MRPGSSTNAAPAPVGNHSPWHSPLPYLFGGLAAMLGLIAFALLVLACSYWKLSGYMEGGEGGERDLESGGDAVKRPPAVFEEKILVIMAGEEKPTYLATPSSSCASSFNSEKGKQPDDEEQTTRAATQGVSMGSHRAAPSGTEDPLEASDQVQ